MRRLLLSMFFFGIAAAQTTAPVRTITPEPTVGASCTDTSGYVYLKKTTGQNVECKISGGGPARTWQVLPGSGGGGTPGGSPADVQVNSSGAFGTAPGFSANTTTGAIGTKILNGQVYAYKFATSGDGSSGSHYVTTGSNIVTAALADAACANGCDVILPDGEVDLGSADPAVTIPKTTSASDRRVYRIIGGGADKTILNYAGTGTAIRYWQDWVGAPGSSVQSNSNALRGFALRQTGTARTGTGIWINYGSRWTLSDLSIGTPRWNRAAGDQGFATGLKFAERTGGYQTVDDFMTIESCYFSGNTHAMYSGQQGDNMRLRWDYFEANPNVAAAQDGVEFGGTNGVSIRDCTFNFFRFSSSMFAVKVTGDVSAVDIAGNYFEGNWVAINLNDTQDQDGIGITSNFITLNNVTGTSPQPALGIDAGIVGGTFKIRGLVIKGNTFDSIGDNEYGFRFQDDVQLAEVGANHYRLVGTTSDFNNVIIAGATATFSGEGPNTQSSIIEQPQTYILNSQPDFVGLKLENTSGSGNSPREQLVNGAGLVTSLYEDAAGGYVIGATKVNLPSGAAFPSSPSSGDVFIVTDDSAIGACDSAAGSSRTLCRWNGAAWVSLGDGGSGGGLADPGSNAIIKRTALNTTAPAVAGTDYVAPGGALGTPSSGTLTNATGLPVGGISGLGTGIATWLATPNAANLAAAQTGETGTGAPVFGTAPTIDAPVVTSKFNWPRVTAFPGSPATGDVVVVTDDSAAGACDSAVGSSTTTCYYNGASWVKLPVGAGSGTGDTVGAASSTDNAIARFDGTTGKIIQNSGCTMDDLGVISCPQGTAGAEIDLPEAAANGTNKAGFKAPDAITTDSLCTLLDAAARVVPNSCLELLDLTDTNLGATSPLSYSGNNVQIANAAADGSTKGAASFAAADFNATSGNVTIDYTNGQSAAADGATRGFASFAAADFDSSAGNVTLDATVTKDAEWDTAAEINTATTDADFLTNDGTAQSLSAVKTVTTAAGNGLIIKRAGTTGTDTALEVQNSSGLTRVRLGYGNASGNRSASFFDSTATSGTGCTGSGAPWACCTGSGTGTCTTARSYFSNIGQGFVYDGLQTAAAANLQTTGINGVYYCGADWDGDGVTTNDADDISACLVAANAAAGNAEAGADHAIKVRLPEGVFDMSTTAPLAAGFCGASTGFPLKPGLEIRGVPPRFKWQDGTSAVGRGLSPDTPTDLSPNGGTWLTCGSTYTLVMFSGQKLHGLTMTDIGANHFGTFIKGGAEQIDGISFANFENITLMGVTGSTPSSAIVGFDLINSQHVYARSINGYRLDTLWKWTSWNCDWQPANSVIVDTYLINRAKTSNADPGIWILSKSSTSPASCGEANPTSINYMTWVRPQVNGQWFGYAGSSAIKLEGADTATGPFGIQFLGIDVEGDPQHAVKTVNAVHDVTFDFAGTGANNEDMCFCDAYATYNIVRSQADQLKVHTEADNNVLYGVLRKFKGLCSGGSVPGNQCDTSGDCTGGGTCNASAIPQGSWQEANSGRSLVNTDLATVSPAYSAATGAVDYPATHSTGFFQSTDTSSYPSFSDFLSDGYLNLGVTSEHANYRSFYAHPQMYGSAATASVQDFVGFWGVPQIGTTAASAGSPNVGMMAAFKANLYFNGLGSNWTVTTMCYFCADDTLADGNTSTGATVSNFFGMHLPNLHAAGSVTDALLIDAQSNSATKGNFRMAGGSWQTGHVMLGSTHFWEEAAGLLRVSGSAPGSSTAGNGLVQTTNTATAVVAKCGNVSLDPPSIATVSTGVATATVTGLAANDVCTCAARTDFNDDLIEKVCYGTSNTLNLRLYNPTGGSIDAAAQTVDYCCFAK